MNLDKLSKGGCRSYKLPQQDPQTLIANIRNIFTPPCQIRIPANEINFLLDQVKALKQKYEELEREIGNKNCSETVRSLSNIQRQLKVRICQSKHEYNQVRIQSMQKDEGERRGKEWKERDGKIMNELKEAGDKIDKLEKQNQEIGKQIKERRVKTGEIGEEYKALKEKLNNWLKQKNN